MQKSSGKFLPVSIKLLTTSEKNLSVALYKGPTVDVLNMEIAPEIWQ
jgi:hypothetical protein